MSSHSFLCHSAASLLLKCANNECLNLGVQSKRQTCASLWLVYLKVLRASQTAQCLINIVDANLIHVSGALKMSMFAKLVAPAARGTGTKQCDTRHTE